MLAEEIKENVKTQKGYFLETFNCEEEKFCFVNLDADLYEPTKAGLEVFCERMVSGN